MNTIYCTSFKSGKDAQAQPPGNEAAIKYRASSASSVKKSDRNRTAPAGRLNIELRKALQAGDQDAAIKLINQGAPIFTGMLGEGRDKDISLFMYAAANGQRDVIDAALQPNAINYDDELNAAAAAAPSCFDVPYEAIVPSHRGKKPPEIIFDFRAAGIEPHLQKLLLSKLIEKSARSTDRRTRRGPGPLTPDTSIVTQARKEVTDDLRARLFNAFST